MERVPVSSSNLQAVGYDPASATLEVAFRNGRVYQYFNVPSGVHEGLMTAASKGSYFDRMVKKAGYAYRQVA